MFLKISILSILLGGFGVLSGLAMYYIAPVEFAIKYTYDFLMPVGGVLLSIGTISFFVWCMQVCKKLYF